MMQEQDDGGVGGDVAALRLSGGLKDAFARLAAAELAPEDRHRWQRRLIAVTNVAKHDVGRAEAQLDRLREELGRISGPGGIAPIRS